MLVCFHVFGKLGFFAALNLCEPMRRSFGQSEPAQDCAKDDVFAFAHAGRRLMIKNKTKRDSQN